MDRTALVTGASSGIGRATAVALAGLGLRVLGTSRDPQRLTPGRRADGVEYLPLDLADEGSVESLAPVLADVDVLINNAGESQSSPLEELPGDMLRRIFQRRGSARVDAVRRVADDRGAGFDRDRHQ